MQLIVGDFPTFLAIVQEIYKPDPLQKVGYNLLLQLSELVQIKNARFTTLMGAEGANDIVKLAVSISTSLISINDAALSKKPHSFQLDARLSSDMYKKFKSQRDEYFKSLVLMLCSIKHSKIEIAKKYIKWINICATENYENNAVLKIIADPSFYVQNEESSNDNDKKIEEVSDLLVNLYVGMLKCGPVISKLTNLVYEFVSINTERVNSNARNYRAIAEQASKVFMINPDEAKGIMMFIQSSNGVGDLGAVAKFVAPISKIDINELKAIDAAIAELIIANSEANEFIERQKKLPPQPQFIARWNDIYHRAVQNTAGLLDLFYMLDTDGDGNGSISKGEFMRLMDRLSLKISPFRLDEIFTRCKEDMESEDFNMAEFSAAFEFIILKYRNYSIFEYGTSFAQLAYKFGTALAILLILLIFLLIGISAFSTGGVFNALTNSGLAMAAGFGMEPNMEIAEAEEGEAGEPDERVVFSMMRALRILKNGEHHEVD
jgi:Ca2+-binding EF-hand superfamily protein